MNTDSLYHDGFFKKLRSFLGLVFLWPIRFFKPARLVFDNDDISDEQETVLFEKSPSYHVAAVSCITYDPDMVYDAVSNALKVINFSVPHGIRVLIKPNIMAHNSPDQAATTHPSVVEALCRIFTDAGCIVTIGDSSAFYQSGGTLRGMQITGMTAVAEKFRTVSIVPFEKTSLRRITSGHALNPFWITDAVFRHDLVVNVPKLKVHQLARYSGALKNMYGCIPGGAKQVYHELFQNRPDYKEFWGEPIVDVYAAVNPELTVMDAVYGLDENGPAASGKPRMTGAILASVNGIALDVVACRMIGFEPRWVPAVRVALERGMADERDIRIVGTLPDVQYVKLPDKKPSKTSDYLFHKIIMTPYLRKERCARGCMVCRDICPLHAITFDEKQQPVINYTYCIRCYCCAEQCPHQAIWLKGGIINRTIQATRKIMKI